MAESGSSAGAGGTRGSRPPTAYEEVGGRQRFTVELRPGETTIVSWKKLHKDSVAATRNNNAPALSKPDSSATEGPLPDHSARSPEQPIAPSPPPPPPPHPSLDPRLAPGQALETENREGPPVSRLSTVIERIERLYVGKASSDEEDINDVVPDDDEYDTEDSFIDDTELDEYFQVDNSAIKHDGFFVNRGKLERINEPSTLPNEQPKKRRRKDLVKDDGGDVRLSSKDLKVRKKDTKSVAHPENVKNQNQMSASDVTLKKKSSESRTALEEHPSGVSNGEPMVQTVDVGPQKIVPPTKSRECRERDPSTERLNDKSPYAQGHLASGRPFEKDERTESTQHREKGGLHERPETSVPEGKSSLQVGNFPLIPRKECSSSRPKSTMLEKAIRDLEKLVSESRPPSVEVQDSDNNTSQAVKRRLPPEIKQKLAKVARLAQASHGKITKELLNRLMSIVGHMIQLRSLKRNLKIMVNMGLSAKQEKDSRVLQIKKEVAEMVKTRIPYMNSKAMEQLAGTSDDFQESNPVEREAFKRKYSMDDALEDKICHLYDQYVEGLEEDAGPQVRKLYAELAGLWPSGFMDNHGIKRAICRAKDRRRALQSRHKDQEKIKRKKALVPKTEENIRVEANHPAQLQSSHVSDASDHVVTSISSDAAAIPMTISFMNGPNTDRRQKQERTKSGSIVSGDTKGVDHLPTKKMKRKQEVELMASAGEERHKSQKHSALPVQKSNIQPAISSFPQPS